MYGCHLVHVSINSCPSNLIIINGDLLDTISEAGYGAFNALKLKALKEGFWSKMVFIRSSSIHDGNLEEFSGFLHQDLRLIRNRCFLFMGIRLV